MYSMGVAARSIRGETKLPSGGRHCLRTMPAMHIERDMTASSTRTGVHSRGGVRRANPLAKPQRLVVFAVLVVGHIGVIVPITHLPSAAAQDGGISYNPVLKRLDDTVPTRAARLDAWPDSCFVLVRIE